MFLDGTAVTAGGVLTWALGRAYGDSRVRSSWAHDTATIIFDLDEPSQRAMALRQTHS